jgi:hypothetical protein
MLRSCSLEIKQDLDPDSNPDSKFDYGFRSEYVNKYGFGRIWIHNLGWRKPFLAKTYPNIPHF